MKVVLFLAALVVATPGAMATAAVDAVEFHPAALATGNATIAGAGGFVTFGQELEGTILTLSASQATIAVIEVLVPSSDTTVVGGNVPLPGVKVDERHVRDVVLTAAPEQAHGITVYATQSMQLVADAMELDFVAEPGPTSESYPSRNIPYPLVRGPEEVSAPGVGFNSPAMHLLSLFGNFTLEFFGWVGAMETAGGHADFESGYKNDGIDGDGAKASLARYVRIEATGGELILQSSGQDAFGHVSDAALEAIEATVLPLAASPSTGLPGAPDENGTWRIEGFTRLESMEPTEDGRIRADLYAEPDRILIDGEPVAVFESEVVQAATGLTIAAVVLGVAAKLYGSGLAALFTRLTPDQALAHRRRRELYDYIKENPGPNFRELVRETGIPAGTCRHHLNVLRRTDVIVEKEHGASVRFFENHGRFEQDWEVVAVLRDPELARVHAWLKEHPGSMQKVFLEHAESVWGWSRSTAQHRLKRLRDNGLVVARRFGRSKHYEAVDEVRKQTPFHPLTWKG